LYVLCQISLRFSELCLDAIEPLPRRGEDAVMAEMICSLSCVRCPDAWAKVSLSKCL
jgi:hypothetical protein